MRSPGRQVRLGICSRSKAGSGLHRRVFLGRPLQVVTGQNHGQIYHRSGFVTENAATYRMSITGKALKAGRPAFDGCGQRFADDGGS